MLSQLIEQAANMAPDKVLLCGHGALLEAVCVRRSWRPSPPRLCRTARHGVHLDRDDERAIADVPHRNAPIELDRNGSASVGSALSSDPDHTVVVAGVRRAVPQ